MNKVFYGTKYYIDHLEGSRDIITCISHEDCIDLMEIKGIEFGNSEFVEFYECHTERSCDYRIDCFITTL